MTSQGFSEACETFTLRFSCCFWPSQAPRPEVQREYIVVSGGPSLIEWEKYKVAPHDRWWGNFIRSARVRIEQLRKQHGPTARITWLVYKPGYVRRAQRQDHSDLIGNIASVRDKYGLNLVFFSDTGQLINYLNNGQPRRSGKNCELRVLRSLKQGMLHV